jgi:hypothetical protein
MHAALAPIELPRSPFQGSGRACVVIRHRGATLPLVQPPTRFGHIGWGSRSARDRYRSGATRRGAPDLR